MPYPVLEQIQIFHSLPEAQPQTLLEAGEVKTFATSSFRTRPINSTACTSCWKGKRWRPSCTATCWVSWSSDYGHRTRIWIYSPQRSSKSEDDNQYQAWTRPGAVPGGQLSRSAVLSCTLWDSQSM